MHLVSGRAATPLGLDEPDLLVPMYDRDGCLVGYVKPSAILKVDVRADAEAGRGHGGVDGDEAVGGKPGITIFYNFGNSGLDYYL